MVMMEEPQEGPQAEELSWEANLSWQQSQFDQTQLTHLQPQFLVGS